MIQGKGWLISSWTNTIMMIKEMMRSSRSSPRLLCQFRWWAMKTTTLWFRSEIREVESLAKLSSPVLLRELLRRIDEGACRQFLFLSLFPAVDHFSFPKSLFIRGRYCASANQVVPRVRLILHLQSTKEKWLTAWATSPPTPPPPIPPLPQFLSTSPLAFARSQPRRRCTRRPEQLESRIR